MRCAALLWQVPPPPMMAPEAFRGASLGALRGISGLRSVAFSSSVVRAAERSAEFAAYPLDCHAVPSASASCCGESASKARMCLVPRRMVPIFGNSARNSRHLIMKQSQKRGFMGAAADRPLAKQSLGQNFLSDEAVARRIVASLHDYGDAGGQIIEFGPGQGALTKHLYALYPKMTALEIDQRMIAVLERDIPSLRIERADMLKVDLRALADERGGALSIISNTPFYLTSPFVFKLLGAGNCVEQAVITMQLEVAEKLLSPPQKKHYGIISVMSQLFGRPEMQFNIGSNSFSPPPKCSVSVMRLHPTAVPRGSSEPFSATQRSQLLALLKMAFEQRRKMMRQTLKKLLPDAAVTPPESWLNLRPEQMPPEQFVELAGMIFGDGDGELRVATNPVYATWKSHKAGWTAIEPRPSDRRGDSSSGDGSGDSSDSGGESNDGEAAAALDTP